MRRYLLDTNIISLAAKPVAPAALLGWIAARPVASVFISAMSLAEIRRGILQLPNGRKQADLAAWFTGDDGPGALFAGRILSFDARAASWCAVLMAEGKTQGRPRDGVDMIIAATALAHGCTMVTQNERDFWGIDLVNPVAA